MWQSGLNLILTDRIVITENTKGWIGISKFSSVFFITHNNPIDHNVFTIEEFYQSNHCNKQADINIHANCFLTLLKLVSSSVLVALQAALLEWSVNKILGNIPSDYISWRQCNSLETKQCKISSIIMSSMEYGKIVCGKSIIVYLWNESLN